LPKINGKEMVYRCDILLKNHEFIERIKFALFDILAEYAHKFLTIEKRNFYNTKFH
jgi:hypothetical protein